MSSFISKWWPSILAVISAVAPIIDHAVRTAEGSHPELAVILASLYAVFTHQLSSPTQSSKP